MKSSVGRLLEGWWGAATGARGGWMMKAVQVVGLSPLLCDDEMSTLLPVV